MVVTVILCKHYLGFVLTFSAMIKNWFLVLELVQPWKDVDRMELSEQRRVGLQSPKVLRHREGWRQRQAEVASDKLILPLSVSSRHGIRWEMISTNHGNSFIRYHFRRWAFLRAFYSLVLLQYRQLHRAAFYISLVREQSAWNYEIFMCGIIIVGSWTCMSGRPWRKCLKKSGRKHLRFPCRRNGATNSVYPPRMPWDRCQWPPQYSILHLIGNYRIGVLSTPIRNIPFQLWSQLVPRNHLRCALGCCYIVESSLSWHAHRSGFGLRCRHNACIVDSDAARNWRHHGLPRNQLNLADLDRTGTCDSYCILSDHGNVDTDKVGENEWLKICK